MVHPEIREKIPDGQVGPAVLASDEVEYAGCDCETQVAQQDQLGVLCLVQRAQRVEVVDTTKEAVPLTLAAALRLTFVVVMTGGVGGDVIRPAYQLLANRVESGVDWGLFRQLGELMDIISHPRGESFTSLGYKDHVTIHVTGGLVVLSVGDLPGEVRH